MLERLRQHSEAPGSDAFTRSNVRKLIDILAEGVSDALAEPVCTLETGVDLGIEHPAATQLKSLSAALGDLDRGLTDEIFKPNPHGSNRSLPWAVRQRDRDLVAAVNAVQKVQGIKSSKRACEEVARTLKETRKGSASQAQVSIG
jgi:Ser/Thr protein kinase RdoA (MazF antagonist)